MSPGLAALAVAVVAGGIIAVSSRESRVAVLGLTLAGVTAPLIGDPLPEPLALAARVVATVLAGYLLWICLRSGPVTAGSPLGWPVEALIAAAAGGAGFGAGGLVAELGPREAVATGAALAAIAVAPMLIARDALRLAVSLSLGVIAAGLLRVGLAGSPPALEQVVLGGLSVAIAAGSGAVIVQSLRRGDGLEPAGGPRAAADHYGGPRRSPGPTPAVPEPRPPRPRSGIGRRSVPGR